MLLRKANKSDIYVEVSAFKPVTEEISIESVYHVTSEQNLNNCAIHTSALHT
jgi:hypothetical protein